MSGRLETVIAGSKPFALALFAPLTERTGVRPRIAADPSQAAALVPEAGLVVVELQGGAWIPELQRLVAARPALRFVAALHAGNDGAAAALRALGVEAVPWTGAASALFPAVDRALGQGGAGGAPVAPPAPPVSAKPPVVAPPAPPKSSAPVLTPAPPPAAARPPAVAPPAPPKSSAPVLTPAPPPAAAAPPAIAPPAPPAPRPPAPADDDFDVDLSEGPAPDPFAGAAAPGSEPAWTPGGDWPANAPSLEISEEALMAGMDRTPAPFPALGGIATQVAGALSELEVKAIARAKLEFDGAPLRRAAAMRVRVGFALATAPPRGSAAEPTAVATLLGEIDEILSEVNALADNAPAERAVALGAARNALVKEAIDFSEVAQRYVVRDADAIPVAPRRTVKAAPAPRVLSVRSEPEPEPDSRQRLLLVAVTVAALVALAYHGYQYLQRREAEEAALKPLLVPAPAGYRGLDSGAGGPIVLQPTGDPVDRAGVERFKADEQAKGNEVIELPSGAILVQPGAARPR